MSALAYNEPRKISAGVLTLMMHAMFFMALYFGVNWSAQQPEGMEVELWQVLPETASPPVAQPAQEAPAPPQKAAPVRQQEIQKPAPPASADIEMAEKKKKKTVKAEAKKGLSKAEQQRAQKEIQALNQRQEAAEQQEQAARAAQAAQTAQAQAQAQAAAAAARAAITSEVEKYKGLIRSKIRRNIVMPPDVADDAEAEFVVTLLPDGSLLDVKLRKSSGNAAYDNVVERAIRKAEPLPLPQDEEAKKPFINPNHPRLKFSPKDME